jgi:hypothetical protein
MLHLLRMAKWVRHPPSAARVKLVFGVIVLALLIVGIEWLGWWPDWAALDSMRRR